MLFLKNPHKIGAFLYSHYRSTAAYRVRIALNYKKKPYEIIPINLLADENLQPGYLRINPQGRVPTLTDGEVIFGQSMAILEYLEERYPNPSLLPKEFDSRGWVRYISQIIISDIHPLNNSSVINYLHSHISCNELQLAQWREHWFTKGFEALENIISAKKKDLPGNFCLGNELSFADVCLVPQIYSADRFGFNMDKYPTLMNINKSCLALKFFFDAHPENQIDFKNTERSIATKPSKK